MRSLLHYNAISQSSVSLVNIPLILVRWIKESGSAGLLDYCNCVGHLIIFRNLCDMDNSLFVTCLSRRVCLITIDDDRSKARSFLDFIMNNWTFSNVYILENLLQGYLPIVINKGSKNYINRGRFSHHYCKAVQETCTVLSEAPFC